MRKWMPLLPLTLLSIVFMFLKLSPLSASDDIPDNCEYTDAPYYHADLFPRYEPQNRRLLLVNWSTGADDQIIATDLPDTRIMGWSADCRYLAVGVGSIESIDTVVFDTTGTNLRVGSVPDAHQVPHHITWGPADYLVVETRNGAILWNVPANTQTTLTTSFDPFTARNFNRLRWDAANLQLTGNLAVGGREVYDLATGQEIELAANTVDTMPPLHTAYNILTIAGKNYVCADIYGAHSLATLQIEYNDRTHALYLDVAGTAYNKRHEVIQVIETEMDVHNFNFRGWSARCRYFAASLGIPGKNASDTVVWDLVENRRVGSFNDARLILHPVHWSPVDDALIIETRDGGYLWYLPDNKVTLLNSYVETPLAGRSYIRSFTTIDWKSKPGQVIVDEIGSGNGWTAYDVKTGDRLATHLPPLGGNSPFQSQRDQTLIPFNPVEGVSGYDTSRGDYYDRSERYWRACNGLKPVYEPATRELSLVRADTGEMVRVVDTDLNTAFLMSFSPGCRYLAGDFATISDQQQPYDTSPLDDTRRDRVSHVSIIWDTVTGERVFETSNPARSNTRARIDTNWSPGGDRLLLQTMKGTFLINLASGQATLLTIKESSDPGFLYLSSYWDYLHGQVIIAGYDGAYAFDLTTGIERNMYYAGGWGCWWQCSFAVHDPQTIVIYSPGAINIWNIETLNHEVINLASYGQVIFGGKQLAISPDQRYVVMVWKNMRVWDLTQPYDEDYRRKPVNSFTLYNKAKSVRFVDNVTVEITMRDGSHIQMNIETGARVPTE